jgi:beta-galactosidase
MKMNFKTRINQFALTVVAFVLICGNSYAREVVTLTSGWKFGKGHHEDAAQIDFDDSQWQDVSVPHDWAIAGPFIVDGDGNTGKLPWKGEGWYRRKLANTDFSGKTVYLLCDGIMAFPEVFINGELAGKWDYGYNSFYLDITKFLRADKDNVIAIHADTRNHDSRWYPGAGIYRKVQLIAVNPVHVAIWGTFVTTPIVKPHYADIRIRTPIQNNSGDSTQEIQVENIILNPAGKELARKANKAAIPSGQSRDFEANIPLTNPQRWDIDHPVLYQVKTVVSVGDEIVDTHYTSFGVRTIRFTANDGFYLNDRRVQLKGVNLHHDHGPLGAAFYPRAMERQLEIMKAMGVNAIRNSHNVAAPELLELCDKMGLLVFNEAFDKYDKKADITEETDFEDFAHRNIRNFVMRDRNHPSVFLWSVGNEIGDVQFNINGGFHRLHTMLNYVRKYDPTRPTTLVCDNRESAKLRHFDYYDVHTWNYGRRYDLARQMEPDKSVIVSESASTVSTRGFYELPLPEKKTDFTTSLQVSSYDLNAPDWAEIADDDFMWQQNEEYIAGEFVWTGFDYLGEPTPYNNDWAKAHGMTDENASRSSYFGIVDLCGIPKDRYYLYKSHWKPDETTVHILPHWNWPDKTGQKIPVFVYTNGDCAELFLNGQSLGVKCKNPRSSKSVERFRLMWEDVVYQPGELKGVAYKEGAVIGENVMKTAGEPHQIRLTPDRKTISADGQDLSYVLIEAFDKNGNPCPLAENEIQLSVEGAARIAGVGNGNPQSFDAFQSNRVRLFYGKAMLILGSLDTKTSVKVTAISEGLLKGTATVRIE